MFSLFLFFYCLCVNLLRLLQQYPMKSLTASNLHFSPPLPTISDYYFLLFTLQSDPARVKPVYYSIGGKEGGYCLRIKNVL